MNEIHINGATLLMPNYILSRTSPPTHIYERKINLGYGIKVDTSDAPTAEPNKGKKMNVEAILDVADQPVDAGTVIQQDGDYPNPDADLETKEWHEKAKEKYQDRVG